MVGTSRPHWSQSSSVRAMPHPARDGQKVDHRVGRPADRGIGADRVLERLAGQDVGRLQVVLHHLHDAPPGQMRHHAAAAVHRRNRGVARQRHPQRLDHRGHGARRCPSCCTTRGSGDIDASASTNSSARHLAGLHGLGELPQMRARPDPFAPEIAVQHRPAGDHDGRQVARGRAHQQARAWSCRSRPGRRRRPSAGRGWFPRPPSRQGCGTSSRWGGSRIRRRENTGTITGKPPAS